MGRKATQFEQGDPSWRPARVAFYQVFDKDGELRASSAVYDGHNGNTIEEQLAHYMDRPDLYARVIINVYEHKFQLEWTPALSRPALPRKGAKVRCKFCGKPSPKATAHRHDGEWVGDECCWDERLRSTE